MAGFRALKRETMRTAVSSKNLVVLDVESTGSNPFVHDPISVALVPVGLDLPPFSVSIRPPNPVWTRYGLDNFARFEHEWNLVAVSPEQAVDCIEQYLATFAHRGHVTLVGHNVNFDLAFLKKLAAYSGKDDIVGFSHRAVDTHSLLYLGWLLGKIPEHALSSDGAFTFFKIDVSPEVRHTAMGDAIATRTLFFRLLETLGIESLA